MKRYANLEGHSGVLAYEVRATAIVVKFQGGERYEYTNASAGVAAIDTMKRLAQAGRGLSTFIARHKPTYARKLT
ncbi:MAG: hypothetical protein EOP38_25420 [Rubrivivax sp.]|nr:MAG: hypothetical protein EOP38_25420 [Rubrivivax sp.]